MEEGQVLFLPPLWFHQVEALDDSISLNVWSFSETLKQQDEVFLQPVPFQETWTQQQLYDAVKVYVTMLVEHYYGPGSTNEFVKTILQTRFKSLDAKSLKKFGGPKDQKYCSPNINETTLRGEMKRGILNLRKFLDPLPKELRAVTIEDYIQDLAHYVAGLEKLPGYLEACFS